MTRTFYYPALFVTTVTSVYRVYNANRKGDNTWIPLPPVTPSTSGSVSMGKLVDAVDKIVRTIVFNTAHPCLYSSYARCCVLRKNGYPVQLNFGMHNLQEGLQPEGHCWLSYEGEVMLEEKDPHDMYPDKLGVHGDMLYWGRLKGVEGKEFVRKKKE